MRVRTSRSFFPCFLLLGLAWASACGKHAVPVILAAQHEDDGAAALATLLAFHGKAVTLDELRPLVSPPPERRASALSIIEAARHYGLEARGVKVEKVADLAELGLPAILHWSDEPGAFPLPLERLRGLPCHFIVLEHLSPGAYDIIDPYLGRRRIDDREVGQHFTGVALAIEE